MNLWRQQLPEVPVNLSHCTVLADQPLDPVDVGSSGSGQWAQEAQLKGIEVQSLPPVQVDLSPNDHCRELPSRPAPNPKAKALRW